MLKSLARTAGFLAYFFITLEMLFMVTPFALYYYSAYAPLLSAHKDEKKPCLVEQPQSVRRQSEWQHWSPAAWLPAFFLPHLSTEIIPSVGGLVFFTGLVGFLVGAIQIYYAKF